jgi:hypothetical protein
MRNHKIALGTLPIAFDLLVSRFDALRQTVALGLLPEMLIIARVYDKKGHQSA